MLVKNQTHSSVTCLAYKLARENENKTVFRNICILLFFELICLSLSFACGDLWTQIGARFYVELLQEEKRNGNDKQKMKIFFVKIFFVEGEKSRDFLSDGQSWRELLETVDGRIY